MSEINDLIHTNAVNAFEQGVKTERARIYRLLKPLSECDPELCGEDSRHCYPDDCSAPVYRHVIQKILDMRLQENTRDNAENVQKVISVDLKAEESERTRELFIEGMAAAHDVVMEQVASIQNGATVWHALTASKDAQLVAEALDLFREMFQDAYFERIDKSKP
jgi:hypothetical protein